MSKFPSFLRLNNIPLYVYTTLYLSSFNGHLGCFHLLPIVNNAAVNIGIQISLRDPDFNSFRRIPKEVELLGHMVILFLILEGTTILFSIASVPFYTPTSSAQRIQFLHILPCQQLYSGEFFCFVLFCCCCFSFFKETILMCGSSI